MNKNIRNIVIFAFVAFSCGWLKTCDNGGKTCEAVRAGG